MNPGLPPEIAERMRRAQARDRLQLRLALLLAGVAVGLMLAAALRLV